ncbi:MAG: hypothetical protein ACT4QD_12090 [Acidobacteriota bacterium]
MTIVGQPEELDVERRSRARTSSRRLPVILRSSPGLERARESQPLAQQGEHGGRVRIRALVANAVGHDPGGSVEQHQAIPQPLRGCPSSRSGDCFAVQIVGGQPAVVHERIIARCDREATMISNEVRLET